MSSLFPICETYHRAVSLGVRILIDPDGDLVAAGPCGTEPLAIALLTDCTLTRQILTSGCGCPPEATLTIDERQRLAALRSRLLEQGVLPRQ